MWRCIVVELLSVVMRGIGARLLGPVMVALAVAVAGEQERGITNLRHFVCHTEHATKWGSRGVRARGLERAVSVVGRGGALRAAAALLVLVLRRARYSHVTLQHAPHAPHEQHSVLVAAEWAPAGEAEGEGAALHARCTPPRPRDTAAALHYTDIYTYCGFNNESIANVYILEEWKSFGEKLEKWAIDHELRLQFKWNITREYLHRAVYEGRTAFLFVDSAVWGGVRGVQRVAEPCAPPPPPHVAFRCSDTEHIYLQMYAPGLLQFLKIFTVTPQQIRQVLDFETSQTDSIEAAAQLWAHNNSDDFCKWVDQANTERTFWVAIFLCDSDGNNDKYTQLASHVSGELDRVVEIRKYDLNCSDKHELRRKLMHISQRQMFMSLMGAVAAGEGVASAASFAEEVELPLLAYDVAVGAGAGALSGRASLLARVLHRLLHACHWRRLALISDRSTIGKAIDEELRNIGQDLIIRKVDVPASEDELWNVLMKLMWEDARIFVVNADAHVTTLVLQMAERVGLTPSNQRLWLVREMVNVTQCNMEHYLISLTTSELDHDLVQPKYKELVGSMCEWWGDAWPRLATTLAEALLAIDEGFARLTSSEPHARDDLRAFGIVSSFWRHVEAAAFPGLTRVLQFEQRTAAVPFVYMEHRHEQGTRRTRWSARAGPLSCPAPRAPTDGTTACLTPQGDPFVPHCNDSLWAGIIITTLLTIFSVAIALLILRNKMLQSKKLIEPHARIWERVDPALPILKGSAVEVREELGAGRFGRVWVAVLRAPPRPPRALAAKALRRDAPLLDLTEFVREAQILAQLSHEHIIRFVGVCDKEGTPLILMEHAFFGDLPHYLRARRHLVEGLTIDEQNNMEDRDNEEEAAHVSATALTRLAREAAEALAYLSERGIIHRDLRAANCLIDARRSLKLADFGMARVADGPPADGEYACRRCALFPVLWMAPESLARGVFSAASDVWSLGVLVLELITLGERPFDALPPKLVVDIVLKGGVAPLPIDASAETRALVAWCWSRAAAERPSARALVCWLRERPRALRPALLAPATPASPDSGYGEPAPH